MVVCDPGLVLDLAVAEVVVALPHRGAGHDRQNGRDRLQVQLGGVQQCHAGGRLEKGGHLGVVAVAAHHLVADLLDLLRPLRAVQLFGAAPQPGLLAGHEQDVGVRVGRHDGGDVATLGHDAQPGVAGLLDDRALHLDEPFANCRDEATADTTALIRDSRTASVTSTSSTAIVGASGFHPHGQAHAVDAIDDGLRVAQVDPGLQSRPGDGSVHGAGVEVGQRRCAAARDTLDLPEPDGPSIATTGGMGWDDELIGAAYPLPRPLNPARSSRGGAAPR